MYLTLRACVFYLCNKVWSTSDISTVILRMYNCCQTFPYILAKTICMSLCFYHRYYTLHVSIVIYICLVECESDLVYGLT